MGAMNATLRDDRVVEGPKAPAVGPSDFEKAVQAWIADMERRGVKPRSSKVFVRQVRDAAAGCGWASPHDINYRDASAWLARQRETRQWSGTTTDGAVSALRCFSRFCATADLAPRDALANLNRSGDVGTPDNRALTLDEVRRIVNVGCVVSAHNKRGRCQRGLYYGFLALTGLRTSEAAACLWGDLDLDAEVPVLWANPKWSKNGKRQRVVLCTQLVVRLREWRKCVPDKHDDRVFPETPNRKTWIRDRIAAGVPELDPRGRRTGLHGLRRFFATALFSVGATDAVVSRLLRHMDSITQSRYIDPPSGLEQEAVQKLPPIFPDGFFSAQTFANPTLPSGTREPGVKTGSQPLAEQGGLTDTTEATTTTHDNRQPAPVPSRKSSQTSPQGSGSRLSPVVGSPELLASAARRESPSRDSRDETQASEAREWAKSDPDNGPVPIGLTPLILKYAEAVERLGLLLERAYGLRGSEHG